MRISSSLIFQTGLKTINTQQADLLHLYEQIGRGQKMVTPADDPLAASQAINISQSQAQNARYADNRSVANRNLATEEDALNNLTLLLQDVRTRLVQAGNGTLSDADRGTLAGVLEKARETAMGIANTTDGNGQYVFSGSRGDVPAYNTDTGAYQGDTLQRLIQADATRQIAGSDAGSDIFERAQPGTRSYMAVATGNSIAPGTPNQGTAVVGKPVIADSSQGNGDARYQFSISFADNGGVLEYTINVTDVSVEPPLALAPAPAVAWVAGQAKLDLGYGTTLDIAGEPADGDSFQLRPLRHESSINLFHTLDELIDVLGRPSQDDQAATAGLRNVLNTAFQTTSTIYDNVLTVRASIGARMNELEALDGSGIQRHLGFSQALIELEDLDYYEATMQLSLRKMALEGASLAFRTIQGLSLFNMGAQ